MKVQFFFSILIQNKKMVSLCEYYFKSFFIPAVWIISQKRMEYRRRIYDKNANIIITHSFHIDYVIHPIVSPWSKKRMTGTHFIVSFFNFCHWTLALTSLPTYHSTIPVSRQALTVMMSPYLNPSPCLRSKLLGPS